VAGTLVLTVLLYVACPRAFSPAGYRRHHGQQRGGAKHFLRAMAQKQEQLAQALLKDPAVDSLSSFIGVDGNNATLNSGRLLINLKPKGERDDIRTVLARLQQVPPRCRACRCICSRCRT
jgi:multidrug efflux pump